MQYGVEWCRKPTGSGGQSREASVVQSECFLSKQFGACMRDSLSPVPFTILYVHITFQIQLKIFLDFGCMLFTDIQSNCFFRLTFSFIYILFQGHILKCVVEILGYMQKITKSFKMT